MLVAPTTARSTKSHFCLAGRISATSLGCLKTKIRSFGRRAEISMPTLAASGTYSIRGQDMKKPATMATKNTAINERGVTPGIAGLFDRCREIVIEDEASQVIGMASRAQLR